MISSRLNTGWTLETFKKESMSDCFNLYNLCVDIAKKEKEKLDEAESKSKSDTMPNSPEKAEMHDNLRSEYYD